MTKGVLTALALLLWLCCALPAHAATPGYDAWLAANPDLAFPGPQPWRVDLDLLRRVNREVNGSIVYRREAVDVWGGSGRYGDCEDYAIAKLRRLLAAGVPRGAMRLAVAMIDGEGHAMLVVADRWVMTNGRDDVFRLDRSLLRLHAWET